MNQPSLVSIVIPTCNGANTLPALLDALRRQQTAFPIEIVAIDSGSTDGTVALIRDRVDLFLTVSPAAFDHGLTRNIGIEHSSGELVVLLVQDAVPVSETWLSELATPLVADSLVAGTFARQRPQPGASPVTRFYHERWVAAAETPRTISIASPAELEALDPMDRLLRCAFDNVCSCIRRSVWEQHPFRRTPIAEDLEWAREVLLAGYRLVYVPRAVVVHSHDRTARYEFARTCVLHRRLYQLFQLRTIPTLWSLARAVATSMALHLKCHREASAEWRQSSRIGRALALAIAWPLGQYLGALSAVRGWNWPRSRTV